MLHLLQLLACPLDWHAAVPELWADVIVGSDILYDPAAVPSVVGLLTQLLGARGARGSNLQCGESVITAAASADLSYAGRDSSNGCTAPAHTRRRASAAYLTTTKRQPSTLKLFEVLAEQHGLLTQELSMQPDSWCSVPVMFQELPTLHDRDANFILHRVTAV